MSKCLYKVLSSISDPDFVKIDLPDVDWKISQKTYCSTLLMNIKLYLIIFSETRFKFNSLQSESLSSHVSISCKRSGHNEILLESDIISEIWFFLPISTEILWTFEKIVAWFLEPKKSEIYFSSIIYYFLVSAGNKSFGDAIFFPIYFQI